MIIAKALQRLLRVRILEENWKRAELESALSVAQNLRRSNETVAERERKARLYVIQGAENNDLEDRWCGSEESIITAPLRRSLEEMISHAEDQASELRRDYLDKRIERKQIETLIQGREAQAELEIERREQQALDDWRALNNSSKKAHVGRVRSSSFDTRISS